MAVGLGDETPYYLELEAITQDGPPRIRATIMNVEGTQRIQLRRTCAGETQVVQGANRLQVTEATVLVDWAAPLGRETTYTVVVDGVEQSTASIILDSDVAWLQDPLDPTSAIPVNPRGEYPGSLTLADGTLDSGKHSAEATQVMVMGSKYPRYYGGQRQAAQGINLSFYSVDEETGDAVAQMVAEAPILLFRPVHRMRPLPPVAYLAGEVNEEPVDQDEGDGHAFTVWTLAGNLVQATLQAAQTGHVTYQQVQDLLGGYTYGEVHAAASSTIYLDWLKNPLIFQNL